jgi:protein-disulfide isomerase/serine/threonine protein kinase
MLPWTPHMTEQALQEIVGSTILNDCRLDALVRIDDALATYAATCTSDGSACTVRISRCLEVAEHQEASLHSALTRIGRHAVGIRGLAPPRTAGAVAIDGVRFLAVVHGGEPRPSAEDRIEAGQRASVDETLALLEPLGQALGALHDQGIVHGAIHPGAIRFDPAGTTLSAFGLGELASVLGGPAAARDVVPARSRTPEQVGIVPASPSPESDSYALAILAVELLAGRVFTTERDPREIVRVIDNPIERPTPRELGLEVSDATERVFVQALRIGPRERTSDPRGFLNALAQSRWQAELEEEAVEQGEPPVSPGPEEAGNEDRPVPSGFEPPPEQRPVRRTSNFYPPVPPDPSKTKSNAWVVYVLVGLGFLLLVGGVGAIFFYVLQAPSSPPTASTAPVAPPVAPPATTPPSTPPPTPPTLPPEAGDLEEDDGGQDEAGSPTPRTWISADAGMAIYPDDATAMIPIDADTAVLGSRDALVTVVLFADMQCPYTRRARLAVGRLVDRFDSELRIAVRNLPLSEHPGAELAAEAGAGSYALGGPQAFWPLFEKMTDNQSIQTRDNLLTWAQDAGVDEVKLGAALDAHGYRRVVQRDVDLAGQLMVRATPTFFINGRRFNGMQAQSTLVDAIESERLAARAALSSGTKPSALYPSRVRFNVTSAEADRRRPRSP